MSAFLKATDKLPILSFTYEDLLATATTEESLNKAAPKKMELGGFKSLWQWNLLNSSKCEGWNFLQNSHF